MASVVLEKVSAHFPIYGAQQRSLRKALFQRATGGSIERKGKNEDRVTVKALTDISLTLHDGDRVGLVGHNGAGKSTLLKLIAGIYKPVSGAVRVEGRVTPLFDVMPGLDTEDSGYENIITSGMLIGLTRAQIEAKIPEIEEFCELGEYLTLPVRTYSTGMTMRLGFALVTALDPGVLLMDEGIGTGDQRFKERAEARMKDFVGRSRILVLASHSDHTVRNMCNKAALMEEGRMIAFGPVDEICDRYYESVHASTQKQIRSSQQGVEPPHPWVHLFDNARRSGSGLIKFTKAKFSTNGRGAELQTGASCEIAIEFERGDEAVVGRPLIAIGIDNSAGRRVAFLSSDVMRRRLDALPPDVNGIEVRIPRLPLLRDKYRFSLFASIDGTISDWILNAGEFEVRDGAFYESNFLPPEGQGDIVFDYQFEAKQSVVETV